jgi:broad specificity phosphatase PhoE
MTKIIFVRHGRTNYNQEGKYDGIGNAMLTEV